MTGEATPEHVRAAIVELRRLRSTDPAALKAVDTVRLTAHTLECWWLPVLTETEPQ